MKRTALTSCVALLAACLLATGCSDGKHRPKDPESKGGVNGLTTPGGLNGGTRPGGGNGTTPGGGTGTTPGGGGTGTTPGGGGTGTTPGGGGTGTTPGGGNTGNVSLLNVVPNRGSALGGTEVIINGSGFVTGAIVEFGGVPSTQVNVLRGSQMRVTTPPVSAGLVDVVVLLPNGDQGRLNNSFLFENAGTPSGPPCRVANYGNPSAQEQEMLDLINRARMNPTAEGQRLGIDLSSVAALPPLSHNADLATAATAHTLDMAQRGFSSHVNPDGLGPNGRLLATNYDLHGQFGQDPAINFTENIASGGTPLATPQGVHDAFMIDAGLPSPKHRQLILSQTNQSRNNREVGLGYRTNLSSPLGRPNFVTQEFARTSIDKPFITGVAFQDATNDGIARAGEGASGVPVTLTHDATGFSVSTTTADAGGYAFEVLVPGTYTISIGGNSAQVNVADDNIKVDDRNGQLVVHP